MSRNRRVTNFALSFLTICVVLAAGCEMQQAAVLKQPKLSAPTGPTKVLAVYQPWFGDPAHMNVGYSAQDPKTLRKQIEQAKESGISGFVVDWYGDHRPFLDKSFALMQAEAVKQDFKVALMFDESPNEYGDTTDDALAALDKAYKAYIGLSAPGREAYLTYQGRPVIFIFPKHSQTNWNKVREVVSHWAAPPLLIYKDEPPAQYTDTFDGFYAWVHPLRANMPDAGKDWGEKYLDNFYKAMKSKHAGKIVVGGAWPGFDDSKARWGLNRHIDGRCGQTFEDTMNFHRRYHDDANPLPFLLIETWNDYEEGTAIERGIDKCQQGNAAPAKD